MKLKTWGKSWDLLSADVDCLSVITYAKFTKAPLDLEETVPSGTVAGTLPELQVEECVYTSTLNILGILRKEGFNADFNLNSIDHSDTLAFVAMIEEKLRPGILFNLWVDSGNYVNVIRPAYCKSFGFFRSYWDLPRMRNEITVDLHCRTPGTYCEREAHFYHEARACITDLSGRLGTKDYFFGLTPTTLDAIVFSYLSILLKAPLVSTQLKNHLSSCDNLCKFCARIALRYFKDTIPVTGYVPGQEKPEKSSSDIAASRKERRNQIISVAVAVTAMIAYSLTMGVFKSRKSSLGSKRIYVEADDMLD